MRATLALFLTLYLLRALVAELNNALSGIHVWLFAGGLFVTYAALAMPFRSGFAASILGGLLCDCVSPVGFGAHAILFGIAHTVVFNLRERIQREETPVRVVVALLVNLGLFLAITILRMRIVHLGAGVWPRLFSDLAWSEVALLLAAPWFFALQLRSLELARAKPSRLA